MFPRPIGEASPTAQAGYRLALLVSLLLWLLPLFAVAWTSVRPLDDFNRGNVWGWPTEFALATNYLAVLSEPRTAGFFLNSVVISVCAVAGAIALSAMAGFALAKHRFRGNYLLLAVFIGGNLVPFQSLMIPVRELMVSFGLYDTRLALILFHIAFQCGFCTLFTRNFFRQVPESLLESARLEGASELQIFWHVALPLIRPALAGLAVLIFTFVWNDYFWSLVLVHSDSARPLTAGLQSLRGMWVTSWNLIAAASIVAAIPPVALFFLLQKHMLSTLYPAGRENADPAPPR
jgi:multiple sugar transport system permease protein